MKNKTFKIFYGSLVNVSLKLRAPMKMSMTMELNFKGIIFTFNGQLEAARNWYYFKIPNTTS